MPFAFLVSSLFLVSLAVLPLRLFVVVVVVVVAAAVVDVVNPSSQLLALAPPASEVLILVADHYVDSNRHALSSGEVHEFCVILALAETIFDQRLSLDQQAVANVHSISPESFHLVPCDLYLPPIQ